MKLYHILLGLILTIFLSCNKKDNLIISSYNGTTHVKYKKSEIISAGGSWSTILKDTVYNETIIVKQYSKKILFEFPITSLLFKNYRDKHEFSVNNKDTYKFEFFELNENEVSENFELDGNNLSLSIRWLEGYLGAKYELTEISFIGNK